MKTKHLKFVRKYLYKYQDIWLVDDQIPFYKAYKAVLICSHLNNRILIKIYTTNKK